jgi:NitT/TauT family transport system permease protein
MRTHRHIRVYQLVLLVTILLLLEIVPRLVPLRGYALWVPLSATMVSVIHNPGLSDAALTTATEIATSWALSCVIGLPLGIALGRSRFLKSVLDPYLIALLALPTFIIYPILITILGIGFLPVVLASFVGGLIGMTVNVSLGIRASLASYQKVARSFRLGAIGAYRRVYLPAAAGSIFAGIRISFVYSFLGVIVTEFLLGSNGLGALIQKSFQTFQVSDMLGSIFLVVVIAAVLTLVLEWAERRVRERRT